MALPFKDFTVSRTWEAQRFTVWINGSPSELYGGGLTDQRKDWQTETRRFIEDAIREKLERDRTGGAQP